MRMNKMTVGMFAMASMLFATSCSQDEMQEMGAGGKYVTATFNVAAPEGINTRAIGDGTTVNKVVCATYDANGTEMTDLRQYLPIQGKQAQYSIRLAKGQNYRIAFFAYYDGNNDDQPDYYEIDDLKNIQILGASSNLEERDAFTAFTEIEEGETMQPIEREITLYRPFAQLNLGSYKDDWDAAVKAGVEITKTMVTVSNVYTAFNAYDDQVVGEPSNVSYALYNIPNEDLKADIDQNGEDEDYKYLALNYLLVGDKGDEKNLTDIKFVWSTADGKTNEPVTEFKNIPVQRNYRTNILGWLLTNPAVFNITIDEKFEKPDYNIGNEGEGGNTGGEGGSATEEEVKMSADKNNYGAIESGFFYIKDKTFDGTVILDESVEGTSGQYYFENVTFNKTIKVEEELTLLFENVNFNATPAISWSNSNTTNRQIMIRNCYVNGTKITRDNKNDYFKSASNVSFF